MIKTSEQEKSDEIAIKTGLSSIQECLRCNDLETAAEICKMTLCILERKVHDRAPLPDNRECSQDNETQYGRGCNTGYDQGFLGGLTQAAAILRGLESGAQIHEGIHAVGLASEHEISRLTAEYIENKKKYK